jgi:hypothetical protein
MYYIILRFNDKPFIPKDIFCMMITNNLPFVNEQIASRFFHLQDNYKVARSSFEYHP